MDNYVPTFTLDPNGGAYVIEEADFYKRLLNFIHDNLIMDYGNNVLCYFEDEAGHLNEATLERPGYYKSLLKCMSFYKELERYEECNKIKELIKKYELQ